VASKASSLAARDLVLREKLSAADARRAALEAEEEAKVPIMKLNFITQYP